MVAHRRQAQLSQLPNRNTAPMPSPIMQRHQASDKLKHLFFACGAHTQSLQVGPSTSSLSPGAPEARLARRRLAWRAGGSPWSALRFSALQNNQLSLASQGQPKSTHVLQGHRAPRGILVSDPCEAVSLSSPAPLLRNSFAGPVNAPHRHLNLLFSHFCEDAVSVPIVSTSNILASRPICQ